MYVFASIMYSCIHTYMCASCTNICTYVGMYMYIVFGLLTVITVHICTTVCSVHHVRTYLCTYVHTFVITDGVRTYVHAYICTYVHVPLSKQTYRISKI